MSLKNLFQFHKGTIRTTNWRIVASVYADFNSIKVQLELEFLIIQIRLIPFQFHKGTIRTSSTVHTIDSVLHFNSIKVQLELVFVTILLFLY